MSYYKINLPDKIYVAEAQSLAQVIYFMAEENMIDEADNENSDRYYFGIEPLREELKANGLPFEIALFNLKRKMIHEGYDGNPDEWCVMLEAEMPKLDEPYLTTDYQLRIALTDGRNLSFEEYNAEIEERMKIYEKICCLWD